MSVNLVILLGRAGRDPEVRTFDGGATKATFTLATTERYKDRNGEAKESTEWHTIVCWRGTADFVSKYVRSGSQVYVEGKIKSRSWDGDDGQKHTVTEIFADNVQLLGGKPNAREEQPQRPQTTNPRQAPKYKPQPAAAEGADDLPFD